MIWDYKVELSVITKIFIGEEGRLEDRGRMAEVEVVVSQSLAFHC